MYVSINVSSLLLQLWNCAVLLLPSTWNISNPRRRIGICLWVWSGSCEVVLRIVQYSYSASPPPPPLRVVPARAVSRSLLRYTSDLLWFACATGYQDRVLLPPPSPLPGFMSAGRPGGRNVCINYVRAISYHFITRDSLCLSIPWEVVVVWHNTMVHFVWSHGNDSNARGCFCFEQICWGSDSAEMLNFFFFFFLFRLLLFAWCDRRYTENSRRVLCCTGREYA